MRPALPYLKIGIVAAFGICALTIEGSPIIGLILTAIIGFAVNDPTPDEEYKHLPLFSFIVCLIGCCLGTGCFLFEHLRGHAVTTLFIAEVLSIVMGLAIFLFWLRPICRKIRNIFARKNTALAL